jgi:O-antigen/teichoic acid export membrane protein
MFSLSIWHLIIVLVVALIIWAFVAIFGRVLNRAGYSRWWVLMMFVPLLNLIMLWVFAYADWPVSRRHGQA